MGTAVGVGTMVAVGAAVGTGVAVGVIVDSGVAVGDFVGISVGILAGISAGISVGISMGIGGAGVALGVDANSTVAVGIGANVEVGAIAVCWLNSGVAVGAAVGLSGISGVGVIERAGVALGISVEGEFVAPPPPQAAKANVSATKARAEKNGVRRSILRFYHGPLHSPIEHLLPMRQNVAGRIMTWDAVGVLKQIVGAFAVVLTLVYMAAQVRQSTRGARRGATAEAISAFRERNYHILIDPSVRQVFVRGMGELENLPEDESQKEGCTGHVDGRSQSLVAGHRR